MPDWQGIVLTQAELQNLPASWQSALSQWRGIYFIYDAGRQAGYVGSACGSENILGRWRDYARTGHGGNKELKDSAASDLRFSILQRTSPDLDSEAIIAKLGGVFAIYELLPAFVVSALAIVIVSLATKAPSEEICKEFDSVGK